MLLVAHELGLAAIWRTGDPAYDPAIKAFFNLPPSAHLLSFISVGYPEMPPERLRRPVADVTHWLGWDDEPGA